jgi:hypothetical protein
MRTVMSRDAFMRQSGLYLFSAFVFEQILLNIFKNWEQNATGLVLSSILAIRTSDRPRSRDGYVVEAKSMIHSVDAAAA